MPPSEKSTSKFVTVGTLCFIGLLLVAAIFYATVKKDSLPNNKKLAESEDPVKAFSVTADKNTFTPREFTVEHLTIGKFQITAVDRDYSFTVDGYPRFDTEIKKGETKILEISSLGVGEYQYFCGDGCTGKIIVSPQADTEELED